LLPLSFSSSNVVPPQEFVRAPFHALRPHVHRRPRIPPLSSRIPGLQDPWGATHSNCFLPITAAFLSFNDGPRLPPHLFLPGMACEGVIRGWPIWLLSCVGLVCPSSSLTPRLFFWLFHAFQGTPLVPLELLRLPFARHSYSQCLFLTRRCGTAGTVLFFQQQFCSGGILGPHT